jgi:predicted MFS family arabinose efflux permease
VSQWSVERTIRFLPFAVFVATFDRAVVAPMLLGMGQDFDVDLATITLSASAYYLAYGLAQPVWGLVSDRLGRIATMRLALVLAGAMDLVSVIPMSIEPFIVTRAIAGAMMAGVFPTAVIFIGDTIADNTRRQPAIAGLQTGVALGLTLGTVLGGIGIATFGWQAFFVATAIACFIIAWVVRNMPNPKPGADRVPAIESFRVVLSNHWSWVLYVLVFVEAGVLLGVFALVPASLEQTGASSAVAGIAAAGYGISVLLTSMVVRRVAVRVPAHLFLLVGGTSAALGFALLAVSVTPVTVFVSVALQGVAWVGMHTTLQTWATTLSDRARATAVSLFAGFMFLGNGVGASIAGYVLDFEGSTALYLGATLVAIVLTVASVFGRHRYAVRLG